MTSENKTHDDGCICHGNWRELVKESEPFLEKTYRDERGHKFVFVGLINGGDDYYYGMAGEKGFRLLSCAASLEQHGYELVPEEEIK